MFDGERITARHDRIEPDKVLTVVGTMEDGSHGLVDRSAYYVDADGLIFLAGDALVIDEKMFQASLDDHSVTTFIEDFADEDPYKTLTNDDFVKVIRVDGEYILIDTLSSGLHVPIPSDELGMDVNTYITNRDDEEAIIDFLDSSIDGLSNDFDSLHTLAVSLVEKTIEHLDLGDD